MNSSQAKQKLEARKKEMSLKAMYFNRFLLVRYITAGFFFANLYWFCSLIMSYKVWAIVPGINLIFIVRAVVEQFTMYSSPIDNAKKTILAYKIILGINVMVMVTIFTPLFYGLFPFLQNNNESHQFIIGIIFIGMIFCAIILKRLQRIKNRTDKQFKYTKELEKELKKGRNNYGK
ncbi:hypothetical protein [Clostridium sp. BJN0001]|uniref:hypothetical protein n=1 Tax=Clostridium sp. BJN0001 TaxID=2930219 RepID=UPI001FD3AE44|nr:hypothetical protein [Clostridium sp. BJN0001]